jgi:hypothetical protein
MQSDSEESSEEESSDDEAANVPPAKARKLAKDSGAKSVVTLNYSDGSPASQNDDNESDSSLYQPLNADTTASSKAAGKSLAHRLQQVNFQELADRVWNGKAAIDPLMINADRRDELYAWAVLFDELKAHDYTAQRLNKGKDVPSEIVDLARPGQ